MEFGIFDVLRIIGALGFFIYGMKVMSEGLQQVAGAKMRQVLGAMTNNRVTGVMTGFMITAILQSSSATTVMTVSFVNAGLLSLVESAGVMMGANIGTTITGWLVSLIGFKVKIASIALPIIAIGFPMMFVRNQKLKKWAEVIIGFALLFLGLAELKNAVPDIKGNPEVLSFLTEFGGGGFLSRLMFVGIGTLLTIVVQSSSAAMTLTIVLTTQGLPIDIAAAMVLGENIGTTITAELASLVANTTAKRSARIHSLFNIIGVTWMILIMPYFLDLLTAVFPPPTDGDANKFTLAAFHTGFNLLNVLILLSFVPWLVKTATRTVKSRGEDDDEYKLEFLDKGIFAASEFSIVEATQEVAKFGRITLKMSKMLSEFSNTEKEKKRAKLISKLEKFEEHTDEMEEQIAVFLVRVSESRLSHTSSLEITGMLSIIGDLERIADIILRMARDIQRLNKRGLSFNKRQKDNLNKISLEVDEALRIMVTNLEENWTKVTIDEARNKENEINETKVQLRKEQMKSVEEPGYNVQSGIIYKDIYSGYEKLGDHIINVTEGIIGEKLEV
ncbi:Na/Pi cotransporter family protein [Fulvivirgaceae bacterium BMA10]|uniref:Na/Pi cotransporter family protein n=1 Tax=Splendidivirga corallicola TaxID=3051826 RepID=A0ABT8KTL5_9BACT|nr:Na/Pi cotransporter family protein [Fulvivirgaceae bacterium BMA10]